LIGKEIQPVKRAQGVLVCIDDRDGQAERQVHSRRLKADALTPEVGLVVVQTE
jgi:hypothetical protein